MEQRDHLIRQINHFARALGKMLATLTGLKSRGQVSINIEQANRELKDEIGFDIHDIIGIGDENILPYLKELGFDDDAMDKLADVLLLLASECKNDRQTGIMARQSVAILEYLQAGSCSYSMERLWKIERAKQIGCNSSENTGETE